VDNSHQLRDKTGRRWIWETRKRAYRARKAGFGARAYTPHSWSATRTGGTPGCSSGAGAGRRAGTASWGTAGWEGGSWGPSEGRWTSRPRPKRWPRFNKHKTTDDDSNRVHPIRRYAARRPPVDARGHGTPRADAMVGNIARARGTCVREPEDAHKHESAYKSIWEESASSEEARGAWRCVSRGPTSEAVCRAKNNNAHCTTRAAVCGAGERGER
jgi:hypothetical protein